MMKRFWYLVGKINKEILNVEKIPTKREVLPEETARNMEMSYTLESYHKWTV